MISGIVTELLEATLRLPLLDSGGKRHEFLAVIDTGFTGSLTLPSDLIERSQLRWLCRQHGMLADGRLHPFDVFVATILWDGIEREVEVEAAEVEPLVGMSMLVGYHLSAQVRKGGDVKIEHLKQ